MKFIANRLDQRRHVPFHRLRQPDPPTEALRHVLVDAIRSGDTNPGTLVPIDGGAALRAVRERLSLHQIGVADLLDAARLTGRDLAELILLGLEERARVTHGGTSITL